MDIKLAQRLEHIKPSATLEITAKAKEMKQCSRAYKFPKRKSKTASFAGKKSKKERGEAYRCTLLLKDY